ncbi:MAG: hypothetical protein AAF577_08275 [Pseudomonadota bacterium]
MLSRRDLFYAAPAAAVVATLAAAPAALADGHGRGAETSRVSGMAGVEAAPKVGLAHDVAVFGAIDRDPGVHVEADQDLTLVVIDQPGGSIRLIALV